MPLCVAKEQLGVDYGCENGPAIQRYYGVQEGRRLLDGDIVGMS
jgi:hypothetical protein